MLTSIFPQIAQEGADTATAADITLPNFMICLFTAIILGVLTSAVFSFKTKHSKSFLLTLALLPMAVAVVIILVNGQIGTGIAVAGAFTLVRFRSIPGTAREIAAIFTTMVIGLALGTGYIAIAVLFFLLTAFLTLVLTLTGFGDRNLAEKQLKITVPENYDYNGLFDEVFEEYGVKTHLKQVRTTNMGTLYELTYLISFPEAEIPKAFVDAIRTRNGNLNVIIGDVQEPETL
jgi:hypothetical protein